MKRKGLFLVILILFISNIFIWIQFFRLNDKDLKVVFLNVGQGDAIYIETPSGNQLLIDGGRNQSVLRELGQAMPFFDRSIDVVLATHPDADHIGGLPEIFKRYKVDTYIDSGRDSDTDTFVALMEEVDKEESGIVRAMIGQRVWLDRDIYLDILFTNPGAEDTNDSSVVSRLAYKDFEVLLTGDASKKVEQELLDFYGSELESDVLKVGHHGSKTSSLYTFIETVDPKLSIVSAGLDNRYGHPHQETLETLEERHVMSTAKMGSITLVSDSQNFIVENR